MTNGNPVFPSHPFRNIFFVISYNLKTYILLELSNNLKPYPGLGQVPLGYQLTRKNK